MNTNLTRRDFLKTTGAAAVAAGTLHAAWAQGDKKITVALVGAAHIHTPGFIDLVKKRDDVRVKSVWDHDAARAEKRAKELNAEVVNDVSRIMADPEVQAVVIYSETNRHHDLVLAAAKAGKHMFVEKPLGITAKESVAMAEAIERANLLFTTGYFMRTDPKHLFLKEEIAKGNSVKSPESAVRIAIAARSRAGLTPSGGGWPTRKSRESAASATWGHTSWIF
jgi:predicted dehydrogenase